MRLCFYSLVQQSGRKAPRRGGTWLVAACCASLFAEVSASVFEVTDGVPAGFEALTVEQTTFVDIRFNGNIVGSSSVTGDDEYIRFDSPAAVTALLGGLKDPAAVQFLLEQSLPGNADRLCFSDGGPDGCGFIDADPVAVIFDQHQSIIDVFVSQDLQEIQSRTGRQYLAPVDSRISSIVSMDAVATALQDAPAAVSLSGRVLAGYGQGYIHAEADYNSQNERKRLRSMTLTHQRQDQKLSLGSYSFQPGGAINGFDLLGASVASSLDTRVDLEQAFSSELVVYLPRQSMVQLLVDERVYAARSYRSGNQVLDTTSLPDGSYELEIRITDSLTGSRSERRQFTKSARIPPRNQTIYRLAAGMPLHFNADHVFPARVPLTVLSGNASRRIRERTSLTLGVSMLGKVDLLNSEYLILGSRFSSQLAASFGSHGTSAFAMRAAWSEGPLNLSVSGEWFRSALSGPVDSDAFQLFPDDFRQLSFSISRQIRKTNVSLRSALREQNSERGWRASRTGSLTLRRSLAFRNSMRGNIKFGLQRDSGENTINIDLVVSLGRDSGFSSTLSSTIRRTGNDAQDHQLGVNTQWHSAGNDEQQWKAGAQLSSSDTGGEAVVGASVEHRHFLASIDGQWSRQYGSDSISNVARFSTQLGLDMNGIALAGSEQTRAGVMLDVSGEPEDATYDIVIDGTRHGTGNIGSTRLVSLRPYGEYTLQILPRGMLASTMSQDTFTFTLLPGMLERIDVESRLRLLLIGTLVDEDGLLVEDAYIDRQPNPLLVESGGFIQLEASPGERIRVNLANSESCTFIVPDNVDGEEVLVVDTPLRCLVR